MRSVRAWLVRLFGTLRPQPGESHLREEIESHVRMQSEEAIRRGVPPDEARRQAVLDLGGIEQTQELVRRRLGLPALEAIWQDVRHGLRRMRKNPSFTTVAVLTLALGIGANTAVFSVVNGVLLRPLPFEEPERLVLVWHVPPPQSFPGITRFPVSPANYIDWRSQNHVFEHLAAYGITTLTLNSGDRPEAVQAGRVASELFSVLRARPALGRTFTAEEDTSGRGNVVILSHDFWKTRFASDPAVVGTQIRLDGAQHTVVGVMQAGFRFPSRAEIWVPLAWSGADRAVRGNHNYVAIARLKDGVAFGEAQAEMDAISSRLERDYPDDDKGWGAILVPLLEQVTGDVRPALFVLFGAVGFVLLIACANLANLLLSRTLDRRKEIALRAALGASRGRVLQQILCETVPLALLGGGLGLIVAQSGVEQIVRHFAAQLPRAREIVLDGRVLTFTLCASLLSGLAAGLAPAWRLTRIDLSHALKQGLGRTDTDSGGSRTRQALLVTQIALSLVLLVGAGLMIRTLSELRKVDPGFDPRNVVTLAVGLPERKYGEPVQQSRFFEQVLERVRALPGVEAAGAVATLPIAGGGSIQPIAIEGRPALAFSEQPEVEVREITPGYLRSMRIPILRGRDVTEVDAAERAPVVLISESMAQKFWPGEDALGKRLILSFRAGISREIVGVVGDVKQDGLAALEPAPTLYSPLAQTPVPYMSLVVRAASPDLGLIPAVTAAILQVDAEQPVVDVSTLEQIVDGSLSHRRFSMTLLAAFAGLALLLATIGIYSVLSYSVRRRVQEIGIRMALGARRSDVLLMVLGQGLSLTLMGLGLGVAAAVGLTRLLSGLLFGVRATDPATFAAVAILLCGVALGACYIPARRAARIDPLVALRQE